MDLKRFFKKEKFVDLKMNAFSNQSYAILREMLNDYFNVYIGNTKQLQKFVTLTNKAFLDGDYWIKTEDLNKCFLNSGITQLDSLLKIDMLDINVLDLSALTNLMNEVRNLDNTVAIRDFNEILFDKRLKPMFQETMKKHPKDAGMSMAKGVAINYRIEDPNFKEGIKLFDQMYDRFKTILKNNSTVKARTVLFSLVSKRQAYLFIDADLDKIDGELDNFKVDCIQMKKTEAIQEKKKNRKLGM